MPLEVRHGSSQLLIHRNDYVASDFHATELVEHVREIELPIGKGYQAHWYFEGIRLAYSRWRYREPFTAEWHTDLDVVHLHFNLRGRTIIENRRAGTVLHLASYQHNLSYAHGFEGTIRNEELESETFILQFTKPAFLELAQHANEPLRRFCAAVLQGQQLVLSEQGLHLNLALHTAIREVLDCRFAGPLKKLFLYSKALEILVLQADAFEQAQAPRRYARTDYDQERLLFARDYLVQHLALPPSLPELARLAGLNEFKLKKGFKELFGQTVFGYLSDYRLADARAQLQDRQKTASELAFELGYSSVQHFSTAFKKKFGVSPTELKG
ncbi:helix-turn-helix transcriptional regulator [Hymenobacter negativus]|uniref:Helix-turn-helix transcriptional regulator n=1 Tax=Hymenobacter negativus TaxID=2795026 RepID=A0ABS3QKQ9_9BACT|nr:AraC family transcriptional regulator [Hymenobacter negativus]MBO2011854.1 helix-turn-helix transcriptional regulator [Hymenobacter negativus]